MIVFKAAKFYCSGGAIAARTSEEEEARVSRTARAAGPKRRLWRDVA